MPDKRPIGIFDSGLGGLTVMKEIVKLMPSENIVYFGDTGRVPYGTRSRDIIHKYALQDEKFLINNNVKLIIAACGTVSSIVADLPNTLPVPFFEVISYAAKMAVSATRNKKIGVIGTSATISSESHKKKILELDSTVQVFTAPCTLFVPFVEEGWISADDDVVLGMVSRYLEPLKQSGVDTLILGCTHYPILCDVIKKVMGDDVTLINPGEALALAVKDYLENEDKANVEQKGEYEFFVSDKTATFEKTAQMLLGEKIDYNKVKQVDIDKI